MLAGMVLDSADWLENTWPDKVSGQVVATDADDNTYLAGQFRGTVDFDRQTSYPGNVDLLTVLTGTEDGFLAKYDAEGQFLWARRTGGTISELTVDSAGNPYVGGKFSDGDDVGLINLSSQGALDAFVAKFDVDGNVLWATGWGTAATEAVDSLFVDANQNLIVASSRGQLQQFTSDGALSWIGQVSSENSATIGQVTGDASGNLYLLGSYQGTTDLDPGPGEHWVTGSTTSHSRFVLKISNAGDFQWATTLVTDTAVDPSSNTSSTHLALSADSSLVLLGSYRGHVDFLPASNGHELPYTADYVSYFARLNPANGEVSQAMSYGRQFGTILSFVATTDGYAASGYTGGNEGFHPTPDISLPSKGSNDAWVMTIDATGAVEWAGLIGGTSIDIAWDLAQDSAGRLVVVGTSASPLVDLDPHPSLSYEVTGPDTFVLKLKQPPPTKFYVVNDGSDRTYEYAADGSAIENYGINSGNSAPRGAASTAEGTKLWVADKNRKVYVYNDNGALQGSWSAGTLGSTAQVEGLATNGTDVWIVDGKSDKVYRYANAAGRLSGSQNAASSFSLNSSNKNPKGIVTDGAHLWVVNDNSTDKVFKYTVSGSLVGSWTIDSANKTPTGLTIDPTNGSQSIWIVDSGADRVYEYADGRTKISGTVVAADSFALAAGNTNPQGIADPPSPVYRPANAPAEERLSFSPRMPAQLAGLSSAFVMSDAGGPVSRSQQGLPKAQTADAVIDQLWSTPGSANLLSIAATDRNSGVVLQAVHGDSESSSSFKAGIADRIFDSFQVGDDYASSDGSAILPNLLVLR